MHSNFKTINTNNLCQFVFFDLCASVASFLPLIFHFSFFIFPLSKPYHPRTKSVLFRPDTGKEGPWRA